MHRTVTPVLLLALATVAFPGAAPSAAPAARLEAYFTQRSYFPGDRASLAVASRAKSLTVQIFRAGPEPRRAGGAHVMKGVPVNDRQLIRWGGNGAWRTVSVRTHFWPSGLYFARIQATTGRVAFAPFVLRTARQVRRRVAVVLPTNTWQAYNFRDDDGDGIGNTWYASEEITSVRLDRPYRGRGVPPYYQYYDAGFIRWLARTGKDPEFLSDDDLDHIPSARRLVQRYDLVIFPGHQEYVTQHAYDLIERYRSLGGNLLFLSANNFFYRVVRRGNVITRAERWRDLGRPEARWIGVQYLDWNQGLYRNRPYLVVGAHRAPWFFRDSGLKNGDRFGSYGIEIDARTAESPAGTQVLASIPNVFGPQRSAEMVFHTTSSGAKVFAAGSMNFGGSALNRPVNRLLENLWTELSRP